jgi:acetylornithine deacetylase
MWTYPPYAATIRDGWMYGRGAHDMKAGVACMVFAMDAIRAAGFEPAADVYLQTVTEEESTGNGALAALLRGYRADAALIPKPTGHTITRAQTGTIWFRLRVRGVPVHVAVAQDRHQRHHVGLCADPGAVRPYENAERGRAQNPWYADIKDPIKFNPGIIRGGDWASPPRLPGARWIAASACCPAPTPEQAMAGIEACVKAAARGDNFLANNPPEIVWTASRPMAMCSNPAARRRPCWPPPMPRVHGGADARTPHHRGERHALLRAVFRHPRACATGRRGGRARLRRTHLDRGPQATCTLTIAAFIADWCGLRPRA